MKQVKRVVVLAIGWAVVLLGIAGLFLPVLQGVLLIMLGLYILSREWRVARQLLERLHQRFPEAYARMRRLRQQLRTRSPFAGKIGDQPAQGPSGAAGMNTGSSEPRSTTDA